jgi:hypothetical protein
MKEAVIHQRLKKYCTRALIMRIENLVGTGMADMFYQQQGLSVWIEAKCVALGKTERAIKVPYRETQYNWACKVQEFGGRVLLAIVAYEEKWGKCGVFFTQPREYINRREFMEAMENGRSGTLFYVRNTELQKFFNGFSCTP